MSKETVQELMAFVQSGGRICPLPQQWDELWQMLPERKRVGHGWSPSAPLILAAWGETSIQEKRDRLVQHIKYAAEHDALQAVDRFLHDLQEDEWAYEKEGRS